MIFGNKQIKILGGFFAGLMIIGAIGALAEDESSTLQDTSVSTESTSAVDTIVTTEAPIPTMVDTENTKLDETQITDSASVVNTIIHTEETSIQTTVTTEASTETVKPTETHMDVYETTKKVVVEYSVSDIPAYSGEAFVVLNSNIPNFTDADLSTISFETYSNLDTLGRCGVAYANIGRDLMPTEERGPIGQVKPTGWHTVKYDCVDGKYLYNRCHLIGYQLTAENANTKNLITGTRYFNVNGMLPFENMVADYINETGNHVLYRVTPIYDANNLLAAGVVMEAMSVEDKGDSILFNVFCYNVQPGVSIDYATGESHLDASTEAVQNTPEPTSVPQTQMTTETTTPGQTYILNKNTHKFHYPYCSSADDIKAKNRQEYTGSRDDIIAQGYVPCKRCNP